MSWDSEAIARSLGDAGGAKEARKKVWLTLTALEREHRHMPLVKVNEIFGLLSPHIGGIRLTSDDWDEISERIRNVRRNLKEAFGEEVTASA